MTAGIVGWFANGVHIAWLHAMLDLIDVLVITDGCVGDVTLPGA